MPIISVSVVEFPSFPFLFAMTFLSYVKFLYIMQVCFQVLSSDLLFCQPLCLYHSFYYYGFIDSLAAGKKNHHLLFIFNTHGELKHYMCHFCILKKKKVYPHPLSLYVPGTFFKSGFLYYNLHVPFQCRVYKCIQSLTKQFHPPKKSHHVSLQSTTPSTCRPLQPLICFLSLQFCLFQNVVCYIYQSSYNSSLFEGKKRELINYDHRF